MSRTRTRKALSAIGMAAIVLAANILTGCHRKVDRERSDIAAIIPQSDTERDVRAVEARYDHQPNPDTMTVMINDSHFKLTSDGSLITPDGHKVCSIGSTGRIEMLFSLQKAGDNFFFFRTRTPNGVRNYVKRLNLDSGSIIWTTDVGTGHMARPIVRGQFAYVATSGFVSKIKLKTGQFDWKYSTLAKEGRFERFEDIDFLQSHEVRFVSPHGFSPESDTVIINDLSGEIILMN